MEEYFDGMRILFSEIIYSIREDKEKNTVPTTLGQRCTHVSKDLILKQWMYIVIAFTNTVKPKN